MKQLLAIIIACVLFSSCIKDRVQSPSQSSTPPLNTGSRVLIHYWNFNAAQFLLPTYTIGGASLSFDFTTVTAVTGYVDSLDPSPTLLNVRNNDTAGNALRVRNPCLDMII